MTRTEKEHGNGVHLSYAGIITKGCSRLYGAHLWLWNLPVGIKCINTLNTKRVILTGIQRC